MRNPILLFCGHHKGGTLWVTKIAASVCQEIGLKGAYVSSPKQFDFDLWQFSQARDIDFLWYANADMRYVRQLPNYRGFHVIRDPRDTIVSGYFSHMNSHPTNSWPELMEHRAKLKQLPREEGLLLEMSFSKRLPTDGVDLEVFDAMRNWDYSSPAMMEVKFEELIKNQRELFCNIFDFLGVLADSSAGEGDDKKISRDCLLEIVDRNSFVRQTQGREPGDVDEKSHYRKGVPGDWKNYFTKIHRHHFKELFGDLALKLGYESDLDW